MAIDIKAAYAERYMLDPVTGALDILDHEGREYAAFQTYKEMADSGVIVPDGEAPRLSTREWLFAKCSGRPYHLPLSQAVEMLHGLLCSEVKAAFFGDLPKDRASAIYHALLRCPSSSFVIADTKDENGDNPLSFTARKFEEAWSSARRGDGCESLY